MNDDKISGKDKRISFLKSVYTSGEAHPVSCLLCFGVCFPANEAGGAWQWPLTSIWRPAINNPWSYTAISQYHITKFCGRKHTNNMNLSFSSGRSINCRNRRRRYYNLLL